MREVAVPVMVAPKPYALVPAPEPSSGGAEGLAAAPAPLLRSLLGDALRHERIEQRRTLREVSQAARVSLGYLSEVERGRKEASSELIASICSALGIELITVLHAVLQRGLAAVSSPDPDVPVLPRRAASPLATDSVARAYRAA